jgi:rSAM/selenodomain-associated transferase 1
MQTPNQCILLFLRAPERGLVKTRLAASLGNDTALSLYRHFVEDILAMLSRTGFPVILWGHPEARLDRIASWLGPELPLRPQAGEDLGRKMANAFSEAFADGFDKVVLVGSDIPDLPPRIIRDAFSALDQAGAAIGPAADGGYYLVAFRKSAFLPEAFENISWSTEQVLPQTLARFQKGGMPVRLLEQWQDIDTIEDLKALSARHPEDISAAPGTLAYIRKAGFPDNRIGIFDKDSRGRGSEGKDQNKT